MPKRTEAIYLEVGRRRVFAGALMWPGWCRSGRDESAAIRTLLEYGPRYAAAVGLAAGRFQPPEDASSFEVSERLKGNATTDFGAPAVAPAGDERPVAAPEAKRMAALLEACWAKFDSAANAASGATLKKGPRGGGRDLDGIVRHVLEAEKSYLQSLGGRYRSPADARAAAEAAGLRAAILQTLASRFRGDPVPARRSGSFWAPRFFVRRAAWHVLDHAWEIEDRAVPANE